MKFIVEVHLSDDFPSKVGCLTSRGIDFLKPLSIDENLNLVYVSLVEKLTFQKVDQKSKYDILLGYSKSLQKACADYASR